MQVIVGWLVKPILEFLYNKLEIWIEKLIAYEKAKAEAHKKNQQVTDQTMAAQTEKERDEAAQNAINKF